MSEEFIGLVLLLTLMVASSSSAWPALARQPRQFRVHPVILVS